MITTQDFKNGIAILVDQQLYTISDYQHVKPGKGGAFVRTKLKRVRDGSVIERTFRVGEKFEDAYIEKRNLQFQYRTGNAFHFMDLKTYESIELTEESVGRQADFLKDNMEIEGEFYNGTVIGLEFPVFVDLRIESTGPGIKGDTAKAGTKPAKVETGATIQVPLFLESGDVVRVDTRTGNYVSRA